jgi:hypothetical protein
LDIHQLDIQLDIHLEMDIYLDIHKYPCMHDLSVESVCNAKYCPDIRIHQDMHKYHDISVWSKFSDDQPGVIRPGRSSSRPVVRHRPPHCISLRHT